MPGTASLLEYYLEGSPTVRFDNEEGRRFPMHSPSSIENKSIVQISKHAVERSVEKRLRYLTKIGLHFDPDHLVFVDKSSFD